MNDTAARDALFHLKRNDRLDPAPCLPQAGEAHIKFSSRHVAHGLLTSGFIDR